MAGDILKQWTGGGLENSNAFVPHFDLPGGSFISSGSTFRLGGLIDHRAFQAAASTIPVGSPSATCNSSPRTYTGGLIITNSTSLVSGSFSQDLARAFTSVSV